MKAWPKHQKVKCDCGHYPKDHHTGEGWCDKCACTWYYPNVQHIKRKKLNEEKLRGTSEVI
jgi:hypothetical protein